MDFTERKLQKSAAADLKRISLESLRPFTPMFAPVYVFMKRNEKFLGIKSPLDFFSPPDLDKVRPFDAVYVPRAFSDLVAGYQDAGRRVKTLMFEKPEEIARGKQDSTYPEVKLGQSSFELSDAVIRVLGPIWGKKLSLEPFFIAAFVEDFCERIPEEFLLQARDTNIELYELGLLRAGVAVFLAIQLGFCNKRFLDEFRWQVFQRFALGKSTAHHATDLSEIEDMTISLVRDSMEKQVDALQISALSGLTAAKVAARFKRIESQFAKNSPFVGSIYGPEGFLHAG